MKVRCYCMRLLRWRCTKYDDLPFAKSTWVFILVSSTNWCKYFGIIYEWGSQREVTLVETRAEVWYLINSGQNWWYRQRNWRIWQSILSLTLLVHQEERGKLLLIDIPIRFRWVFKGLILELTYLSTVWSTSPDSVRIIPDILWRRNESLRTDCGTTRGVCRRIDLTPKEMSNYDCPNFLSLYGEESFPKLLLRDAYVNTCHRPVCDE